MPGLGACRKAKVKHSDTFLTVDLAIHAEYYYICWIVGIVGTCENHPKNGFQIFGYKNALDKFAQRAGHGHVGGFCSTGLPYMETLFANPGRVIAQGS